MGRGWGKTAELSARAEMWVVAAIGVVPTFLAIRLDQSVLTIDLALVRLGGLLVYCLGGAAVLRVTRGRDAGLVVAISAAAVAAAAHGLIDVTGVWPASAAVFAALVGCASAGFTAARLPARSDAAPKRAAHIRFAVAVVAGLACFIPSLVATWPMYTWRWERRLVRAAADLQPLAELSLRWRAIAPAVAKSDPSVRDEVAGIARTVGRLTGREPRSVAQIEEGLIGLDREMTMRAGKELRHLASDYPREWKLRREASRVKLREALLLETIGKKDQAAAQTQEAYEIATRIPRGVQPAASELAWASLIADWGAKGAGGDQRRTWLERAAASLQQTVKLAPYDLDYAKRLMLCYEQLGDHENARMLALRTLELNEYMKYDAEVRGLSSDDRARAERLAREP